MGVVSGSEGAFGKHDLLLFSDVLTQSIVPAEHVVCGDEMFTQKQVHYFFPKSRV